MKALNMQKGEWYWVRFPYTDNARPACFDGTADGVLYFRYIKTRVAQSAVLAHIKKPDNFAEPKSWDHPQK